MKCFNPFREGNRACQLVLTSNQLYIYMPIVIIVIPFNRCVIEASSTATGNAEIVLRPMRSLEQDAQFCHDQAVSIARMINTPSSDSSASFQFLLGASTARAISTNTTGPSGGAGSTTAALSFLMIAVLIAVLFQ